MVIAYTYVMATGTSSPPPLPANTPATRIVDDRLAQVGSTLKSSDMGGGLMRMLVGLLAIAFLFVLVDHWVVGLPIWARCAGLLLLVSWVGWCLVRWVLPGALRRINPAYAAQLVERAHPSLRNSLLNFVFLREQRDELKEPVYRELEHRATARVQTLEVDSAVDRTNLIRVGMVAAVLLFVFAVYTALSPKSPISTLARLLLPWKAIDRPSRVRIVDVRPGTTTVYSGRSLDVSARVERTRENEPVYVVYTTVDRQVVDRQIPMQRDEASGRFLATIPAPGQGIRAQLDYRLESGDAVAGPFRVTVSPMPSMMVERAEYEFPEYTKLPAETVESEGDLRAVEGTRVRIHAVANQPISSAYLEFDPDTVKKTSRRTVRMTQDGNQATVSFRLRLRDDRRTPVHQTYQLRFVNAQDETNAEPILHRIDVEPDLPPIVEFLTPTQRVTDVPLDGSQPLEIRGIDPDFGLANLTLHGVARGMQLFEPRSLLAEVSEGQVIRRLTFRPQRFGLQPGDMVEIWATGYDNRFDVFEQTAAPNFASETDRYQLRITASERRPAEEPADQDARGEGSDDSGSGGEGQPGDAEDQGDTGDGDGAGEAAAGNEPGDNGQTSPAQGAGDGQNQQQPGENPSGPAQPGEQQPGEGAEGGAGQSESGPSESPAAADAGESSPQSQSEPGGESEMPRQSAADPSAAGEDADATERPADAGGEQPAAATDPSANRQPPQAGGARGDDPSSANESPAGESAAGEQRGADEPLPSDGSSDGDVFERVMDRMRELNGKDGDGMPNDEQREQGERAGDPARPEESSDTSRCPQCNAPKQVGEPCENCSGGKPSGDPGQSSSSGAGGNQQGGNRDGQQADSESTDSGESEGSSGASGEQTSGQEGEAGDSKSGDSNAANQPGSRDGSPQGSEPAAGDAASQPGEGDQPTGSSAESSESAASSDGAESADGEGSSTGETPADASNRQPGAADPQADPANDDAMDAGEQAIGEGASESSSPPEDSPASSEGDQADPAGSSAGSQGAPGDSSGTSEASADSQPNGDSAAGGEQPGGGAGPRMGSDALPGDEDPPEPGGDDPNLEYARQATDLVLDFLKNQEGAPDPELLDRLGWTAEDLERFVNRWEALRQDAVTPQSGDGDGKQLDQALRSLGLHPGRDRLQQAQDRDDQLQGVQDTGVRSAPPSDYEHLYKEFMRRRGKRSATNGPRQ